MFTYLQNPVATWLKPTSGPLMEVYQISIHGTGFYTNLRVTTPTLVADTFPYKSVSVTSFNVSETLILFQLPPSPSGPGTYHVKIFQININLFCGVLNFRYRPALTISSFEQNTVVERNLVPLALYVEHLIWMKFPEDLICCIGLRYIPDTWISNNNYNVVMCPNPYDLIAVQYTVVLEVDGTHIYVADNFLVVHPTLSIVNIFPRCGPSRGGTRVTMVGFGFSGVFQDILCSFENLKKVHAKIYNDTHAICIRPPLIRSISNGEADRYRIRKWRGVVDKCLLLNNQNLENFWQFFFGNG